MRSAFYYGMRPAEFWDSTPGELACFIEANKLAEESIQKMHAHFTACVMNMWTKKRVRGFQLLGGRTKTLMDFGGSIKAAKQWALENAQD